MVLEIGTGLGYQSAVLAELAGRVYSAEIIDELAQRAVQRLKRQGYTNVGVRVGNGYAGWPKHAPFDVGLSQKRILSRVQKRASNYSSLPWSKARQ